MIENRILLAEHKFLSALFIGGIKPICEAAYELFELPMTVVDNYGRYIFTKPDGYIEKHDKVLDKFLTDEESINVQQAYAINKVQNFEIAYITDKNIRNTPLLMGRFFEKNFLSGYFGITFGSRLPNEEDYQIATLFSKTLSSIYTISSNPISSSIFRKSDIIDFLDSNIPSNVNWQLSSVPKPKYLVLVSPIMYTNKTIDYRICDSIAKNRNAYSVIYENNIVTLYYGLGKDTIQNPDSSNLLNDLLGFLTGHNYITGISAEFSRLQDMKAYYMQALYTINIGMRLHPDKKSYIFTDYTPLQFFLPITELPMPQAWLHPIVNKMRHYDKKNNTEYLTTMKAYLISGRNRKETAKQLNIHLNTLTYRLDKMENLFNISELNIRDNLYLLCSLLLIELNI